MEDPRQALLPRQRQHQVDGVVDGDDPVQLALRIHHRQGEEEITNVIAKYNLLALPVVDAEGELHGIITIDDAIDLVLPLAWKKRLPRFFH